MTKVNEIKSFYHFFILILSMFLCGLVSLYYGKDLGWDLANYHFNNPYAFLHHRLTIDYWPASYPHIYLSPTADFIAYFLIKYCSAGLAVFISGAIHGINLWLLFLIANCFLPPNKYSLVLSFLISLLGMYGPIGFTGIGDFKVDHTVSIFILSFVFLQLKAWKNYSEDGKIPVKLVVAAGCMLGIAVGLKLTAALFSIGTMFAFALLFSVRPLDRIKIIFLSGSAIILGDLLSSGYWMITLWKYFHNPFYPYFNNIFNHESFSPPELREGYTRMMPHGILKILFYPFYFSFSGTGDGGFRDFRFLFVYVLFIFASFNGLVKKVKKVSDEKMALPVVWLLLFFVFSYMVGQYYFASIRYMLPLEMLAPIVIYLLVQSVFRRLKIQLGVVIAFLYVIALTMYPNYIVRVNEYKNDYMNVKIPESTKLISNAMVLIAYPAYALDLNPRPSTYLIPFFPKEWQYIGIAFRKGKFSADTKTTAHIHKLIADYHNNFFVLSSAFNMPELIRTAKEFGLVSAGACEAILSSRQAVSGDTLICPVVKR